ncbi:MAG: putative xylanase [Planctomycetota bacterium]|nr:MAG: putative xylanase [Planctomycetota bacterium]
MLQTKTPGVFLLAIGLLAAAFAQEPTKPTWKYSSELLRPFWQGDTVEGESVLFIKDEKTGEARASVLFPIREVLTVRNSVGDVTFENGKDFVWKPDSREIVLPAGSRIPSRTPQELRRPAKSQKYELTHRDGNGEIFSVGGSNTPRCRLASLIGTRRICGSPPRRSSIRRRCRDRWLGWSVGNR